MKKILFISHDAYRAGGQILLINLAELILLFSDYEVHFLLKNGGELENDFKKLAPTFCLYEQKKGNRFFKKKSIIEDSLFLNQYDCIVSNTITNGDILGIIKDNYKGRIITYIHELSMASKTFTTNKDLLKVITNTDLFCVPSSLVKEFIIKDLNILKNKTFLLPYYIQNKEILETQIPLKIQSFIIGGCGTIDWRKGPDLFLQVAQQLFVKYPDISILFKWRGATNGIELERLNYQLEKANLTNKVFFDLATDTLDSFYNEIDLLLLTSREDPYPLVVLEAASFAKPTICFDEVCGSIDFINKSDGGVVVPFLDIPAIVSSILLFYEDELYRKQKGENAREYLLGTHSNKKYVYDKFVELIERAINA
ncbi:glycosyltransferase family 4 protein [Flavobacterium sp. GSA192]|uniref:glycosyltransferase family 4 protein n=1 Tax=Flavobacterium sp. GSA192 TaxID=2576304 RepID=UPI00112DAC12|nr:glycosyltransferase family 4 protein [Flavobacterium sp. GSA192]